MGKVIYNLSLDLTKNVSSKSMLGLFKGENESRRIQVTLNDGGKPFPIPDEYVATIYVKKPQGTTSVNGCTISDNVITYDILGSDIDAAGVVEFQLKVIDGNGGVLLSCIFEAEVDESIVNDSAVPSQPTYTVLDTELNRLVAANTRMAELIEDLEDLDTTVIEKIDEIDEAIARETEILNRAETSITVSETNKNASYTYAQESLGYKNQAATQVTLAQAEVNNAKTEVNNAKAEVVNAKSWAVGGTGTRTDENTNNSKFWSDEAKRVVAEVDTKLKVATFDVDSNGNLIYTDNPYIFTVADDGNLYWEVSE